jgi:Fe-S-cluster containining protein
MITEIKKEDLDYINLFSDAHKIIDIKTKELIEVYNKTITCKPKCYHCCYYLVSITIPEALYITLHVKDVFIRTKIKELQQREKLLLTGYNDPHKWFKKKIPCIFLLNQLCKIHEIKPIICRITYAFSQPKLCKKKTQKRIIEIVNPEIGFQLSKKTTKIINIQLQLPDYNLPMPLALLYAISGHQKGLQHIRWQLNRNIKKL